MERQLERNRVIDKFHPAGAVRAAVRFVWDMEFSCHGQKNLAAEGPSFVFLKFNCQYMVDLSTLSIWEIET